MIFNMDGTISFNDVFELNYNLFNTIGLSVNSEQYLYDQDTGIVLKYNDKSIKSATAPMNVYAGKNDVIFDPAENYDMMVKLFGYWLDKEISIGENPKIAPFVSQYIEDNPEDKMKQRVSVCLANGVTYTSRYYNKLYLGYMELIFLVGDDQNVDLSNFDVMLEEEA